VLNCRCFGFPYFDNDAFIHHALHILDAPPLSVGLWTSWAQVPCTHDHYANKWTRFLTRRLFEFVVDVDIHWRVEMHCNVLDGVIATLLWELGHFED